MTLGVSFLKSLAERKRTLFIVACGEYEYRLKGDELRSAAYLRDVTLMYSRNFDETYISKSSMALENQVT